MGKDGIVLGNFCDFYWAENFVARDIEMTLDCLEFLT